MTNLKTHIEVFASADRLMIEPLKELAANKAFDILPEVLRDEGLASNLNLIIQHTLSDEPVFRIPFVAVLFSKQLLLATYNRHADAILHEQEEPVAHEIVSRANKYVKGVADQFNELKSTVDGQNAQLTSIRRQDETNRHFEMVNLARLPKFFREPQYCPKKSCCKKLFDPKGCYIIKCEAGIVKGRERYYLVVCCKRKAAKESCMPLLGQPW